MLFFFVFNKQKRLPVIYSLYSKKRGGKRKR